MPLPQEFIFFNLNTQDLELDGLIDAVASTPQNPVYINGLNSLVAKLVNRAGQVDPVFQGIPLAYVPNSNGVYRGTIPGNFNAVLGAGYKCVIDGNNGGAIIHIEVPSQVQIRKN